MTAGSAMAAPVRAGNAGLDHYRPGNGNLGKLPPPNARGKAKLSPLDGRRTIGFLISDVARMMRSAFDRRVRRLGLTRSQWLVLSLLHRRPGVSQSELAEMLEVEPAAAGRMIDR